jgi:hypothetical protein
MALLKGSVQCLSFSYHDSLHFSLDLAQPSVVHPELARPAMDNGRLELPALAYSENGENTLLDNGTACPWPNALQSYKEYTVTTPRSTTGVAIRERRVPFTI